MATPFTHDHLLRLSQALLDAFDALDDFERLARQAFDVNLHAEIAVDGRNTTQIAEDLIDRAASHLDGVHRLVNTVLDCRPDDVALCTITSDWADITFLVRPWSKGTYAADNPPPSNIRSVVTDEFVEFQYVGQEPPQPLRSLLDRPAPDVPTRFSNP